jgi:hypothetical protein
MLASGAKPNSSTKEAECLREYGLLAGTRRERRTVRGAGGVRGTDGRGATEVDGTGRTDTFFPT